MGLEQLRTTLADRDHDDDHLDREDEQVHTDHYYTP